jgi:acyl-CoA oxidase
MSTSGQAKKWNWLSICAMKCYRPNCIALVCELSLTSYRILFRHELAFSPPLFSQGSEELVGQYGSLAKHHGLLGAYAQTELGHGSNVAALETTATFLPESQTFEIHSPTLTSTKWWIGSSGLLATHAVVQAQLILPTNKLIGPHLFLVQLRDERNHLPLPGVVIGDIGIPTFEFLSHSLTAL